MTISNTLVLRLLTEPSPDDLWRLHPYLLALDTPESRAAREVARSFYAYLNVVQSKLSSKQYSSLAAVLAAGSVGAFSVQELIDALRTDRENALRHLLVGGIAETLEVLATMQHVKAWEVEFAFTFEEVVWTLYEQWWRLSAETQPNLLFEQRQALVESLLIPLREPSISSAVRVVMAFRLFQILLLVRLVPLLEALPVPTAAVE